MKIFKTKIFLSILPVMFLAASCNLLSLSGGSGVAGVLQTTDSGDSFHDINKIDKKNNLNSTSVNSLVFAKNDSQTLYLGSSGGIFQSDGIGNTWKLLVTKIAIADIAVHPYYPQTIFGVGLSDGHGKIIKSEDAGASWKDVYTEPTSSNAVMSIAIDPVNHFSILAGLQTGDIIHSIDGGNTWKSVANIKDKILKIRFAPNHNLYVLASRTGIYESTDGGNTFPTAPSSANSYPTNNVKIGNGGTAISSYLDIAFDPNTPGVIYLGTDQGLIKTNDDGATWTTLQMPVRNGMLRTSSVSVNPKDSNNIYATIGATLFKSNNAGNTWQTKPLPTGQETRLILFDPVSPNVVYLGLGAKK